MKNNYFLMDLYKQLNKWNTIKDYIKNTKDNFLTEELWKIEIDNCDKKIDLINEQLKLYR